MVSKSKNSERTWKRLGPGVYDDEQGGLHLDIDEVLAGNGFANTPENRTVFIEAWREWARANDTIFINRDEPDDGH
jgi:hypothetical protein